MKTLKTTLDGQTNQVAPQWIEVKVSHIMNVYFRLVMFCNFVFVRLKYFYIECRVTFKVEAISVTIMSWMWNIVSGELKND